MDRRLRLMLAGSVALLLAAPLTFGGSALGLTAPRDSDASASAQAADPSASASTSPSASPTASPTPTATPTQTPTQTPTPHPPHHVARGWKPPVGGAFNVPRGRPDSQTRLIDRVIAAVRHTHRGATIRFAQYSFDRHDVARALMKAHGRGVNVQMIVNDNWTSGPTHKLREAFGHNRKKDSWVVICHQSCRGGAGNLHLKVYSFDRTGGARDVIMTGSTNLTDRAVHLQWNDLYTIVGNAELFEEWLKVFSQLSKDHAIPQDGRWITFRSAENPTTTTFYRPTAQTGAHRTATAKPDGKLRMRVTKKQDPVLKRLNKISCKAKPGSGVKGHTVVRIIMYAWHDGRGNYLAERVAQLARQGCDVRAILSVSGGKVRGYLNGAGVPMRSADYDYLVNEEGQQKVNFYSHLKILAVNGTYDDTASHVVWTGSENWSSQSFGNDEITLELQSAKIYSTYTNWFQFLWAHGTHPMAERPSELPPTLPY